MECCGCQEYGNVVDSCPQATGEEEEEEEDTNAITTRHDCSTDHGHILLLWGCVKKKFLNFIPKTAISRPSSKDVSSGAPDFSGATEAKASVKR